jgi:cytochrome c
MRYENIIGGFALATGLFVAGGAMAAGDTMAAGDADVGKVIFSKTCGNCHSVDVGVNKVGPSLYGIIGRKAGVVQGYEYSDALKNSDKVWTVEQLDIYLSNPLGTLHGVKMNFKGLPAENQRADVIAYLQSLQD